MRLILEGTEEQYDTLCFKTKKTAIKNEVQIKSYFENRFVSSKIKQGVDERCNKCFYVEYTILK